MSEKIGQRILAKLQALTRMMAEPGVLAVVVRGGDVRTYVALCQPWVRQLKVRTVVDVGANIGQFAEIARRAFPEATLHCFEPLPDCFATLSRRLAHEPRVFLHNVALAHTAGSSIMMRSAFSPSSSLREMDPRHVQEFPWTAGCEPLSVSVATLDGALADAQADAPLLIKIDVQGTEDRVIEGGRATLARAAVVIVETSFAALYKEQPLFDNVNALLASVGFRYQGNIGQLISPHDGRVLQSDSVFVRS